MSKESTCGIQVPRAMGFLHAHDAASRSGSFESSLCKYSSQFHDKIVAPSSPATNDMPFGKPHSPHKALVAPTVACFVSRAIGIASGKPFVGGTSGVYVTTIEPLRRTKKRGTRGVDMSASGGNNDAPASTLDDPAPVRVEGEGAAPPIVALLRIGDDDAAPPIVALLRCIPMDRPLPLPVEALGDFRIAGAEPP